MTITERNDELNRNYNLNFIIIEENVIREAMARRLTTKIAGTRYNSYYNVEHAPNTVLMHVRNNKYIAINHFAYFEGDKINIVDKLLKHTFNADPNGKNRERVKCTLRKEFSYIRVTRMTVERIIVSYREYGELTNLSSKMHVHHKAQTWDSRDVTTTFISEEEHDENKSHKYGLYVPSIQNFRYLIELLNQNEQEYKDITVK